MRVEVPPGQSLPNVLASVAISRAEVVGLRTALDSVLATGSSTWKLNLVYADVEASVRLALELDVRGTR